MDVPGFALITGGGSGIGRACAQTFAREGAAGVALLDVNHEGLLAVKAEVEQEKRPPGLQACRVEVYVVDVRNEDQVNQTVNQVAQTFGRIDYVVNAAGVAKKHEGGAAFARTDDWQRVLDINLTGTFFVLRAAAQIMLKQERIVSSLDGRALQRGSIVNFGSILGHVGVPTSTAYTASKHGVLGLTRTASEDYAARGLRINAICPGYIDTPMTNQDPVVRGVMAERVANAVPMQRAGQPQEIADGVVYLCGGRSSFVTGTALFVDGGYTER
ncbi:uncharacterized protein Z520_03424 [Fonsecaea multimorphosa CBS 102226]|uniref:Ketoreductase domain-containing protein n=1 Tax=Fonsecaea multimorphosa CBS 102226 TaxID=1442371 RepID=A0A0D2KVH1_9EURO|nr:uncharacterized protein Z520_03424 [Fonsecaea multimorphosa CBS 102226]KIY00759.1 hypothetical protein Z520_03424 [Fonsecaea multimorphosa CBS 102226]OAL27857.1 hypothetical protein AYO22_03202 [Fonsecaea multimorphosa]